MEAPVDRFRGLTAVQVLLGLGILAVAVLLPQLPERSARMLMGASLAAANGCAGWACLRRARRFPEEAGSWRLMTLSVFLMVGANVLIGLHRGPTEAALGPDTLIVFLYGLTALTYPWALLRLPLRSRHPEGFRIHLLGGMVFGSSLALLLWILGIWQASAPLSWLDKGLLLTLCLRAALMGGVAAYQMVEAPARMKGPLGWLVFAISLGAFPGIWSIAQKSMDAARIPYSAGFSLIFPVALVFAALRPLPADGPPEGTGDRHRLQYGLLYLPYFGSAACLLAAIHQASPRLLVPMLGFLVVSTLLVIHQFALLSEVRDARDLLDARVRERTWALEQAQEVLLRTERMNGLALLGAGLTHDLNNALGAILQTVDLVRLAKRAGRLPNDDDLNRIEKAARYSSELSGRVMAFAREEPQHEQWEDLGKLVLEGRELLQLLLPRRIALEVDPGKVALPILAAPGRIQQVLVNLVGNARDAISGAGTIRVSLARGWLQEDRPCVTLEVADSGSGMGPEVLDRLFQPLFTTKPSGKGTGLGLASVKIIVEGMGGRIQVQSTPGAGTTFSLHFPLQEPL